MPQAVDEPADLLRAMGVKTGHLAEPPVPEAGYLFQQIGFDIDHPVAPAAFGG